MTEYGQGQANRAPNAFRDPQPAATAPPVHAAQQNLDESLASLQDAVRAMRDRLGPVLGPSRPTEVSGAKSEPPSTVSQCIFASASRVRYISGELQELIDRLEV